MMKGKVIVLSGEGLGRGEEQLGKMIMANMLRLLGDQPEKPRAIFCWNAGVKLVTEGSLVLEHLKKLEESGVEILACRTCIEWFDLEDKVQVGKISSMQAFLDLAASHEVMVV